MNIITKHISASFARINALKAAQTLKLKTDHNLLSDYGLLLNKIERGYSAKINFKPFKGFSSTQMHRIKLPNPIILTNENTTYFIPENSIHLHQVFNDFFGEDSTIDIVGTIDRISTAENESNFDNKFLRFVVPVTPQRDKLKHIRGYHYTTDTKTENRNLLKVRINATEYHFYEFKSGNDAFLAIDSTELCKLAEFQKICISILLGLGFLYGNLYLDEGFLLSSSSVEFKEIDDISFSIYRESIMTTYSMHTTNAYSVHDMTAQNEEEDNKNHIEVKKWINLIIKLENTVYSSLCELLYNSEPISRAVITTLQANLLSLEIKGSAYSLALEAITAVFMKENKEKTPKPVADKVFNELKKKILNVLEDLLPASNENQDSRKIFKARIDNLNSPSNTDKLQKSFDLVNYKLQDYEIKALKARDKFQHGELPVTDNSDDTVFREVYFMTLIMHRMIYTLVLKRIGYDGYIINYPQLHRHMTDLDLQEEAFYKL